MKHQERKKNASTGLVGFMQGRINSSKIDYNYLYIQQFITSIFKKKFFFFFAFLKFLLLSFVCSFMVLSIPI